MGTLYDAREEGYDLAMTYDGIEWDIATGEPTGAVYGLVVGKADYDKE